MDFELISVIIPTRNRCHLLKNAIETVSRQTWPKIEVIIIDDASTDGTSAMVCGTSFRGEPLRIIRNEMAIGGAASRNSGIAMARGPWIAFLDDDDEWLPEKLATQVEAMSADPTISAVSCSYLVRKPSGRLCAIRLQEIVDEQSMLSGNRLGGASVCFTSKDRLRQVGGFDPELRSAQDYDLWIRLWDAGRIAVIDTPLTIYVPHRGVRISRSIHASYVGLSRVYHRYRHRMSTSTRQQHLSELLCMRTLIYGGSLLSQIHRCQMVFKIGGARKCCSCLGRLAKARLGRMHESADF